MDDLFRVFGTDAFFNAPAFATVFVMFRMFARHVSASGSEAAAAKLKEFTDRIAEKPENQDRLELLTAADSVQARPIIDSEALYPGS